MFLEHHKGIEEYIKHKPKKNRHVEHTISGMDARYTLIPKICYRD